MTADAATDDAVPVLHTEALEAVFATGDGVGPVDLRVAPGEQVLLLGPSGAGKSTVLRCLHGAVPHVVPAQVTGRVRVAGRDVATTTVAGLADVVGVLAQDPETGVCLPDVDEEVAFPLENLGVDPDRIGAAVDRALDVTGAAHLRDRRTDGLSGGELQRVALAAALAPGPALLLLDEPTSMLDADGVAAVRSALAAARDRTGAACVLVEHRLDELAGDAGLDGLPGRWVVLDRQGRVTHDGPAADVASRAGADLLARGCWLPLDVELAAAFGGPVGSPDHQRRVLDLAARAPASPVVPRGAGPTLVARGLAVAPPPAPGRRRRDVAPVLHDVDLTLRAGEVVALVGPNGSGKSTLLACLAGVARPAAGTVTGPRAGLVLQNPEHQLSRTTVRAEVAAGLPRGPATDARVTDVLERFDLTGHADHHPHQLSGGQQRRLGLAAAHVHDRPFLLADEPTFGLDRHGTVAALRALTAAAAQGRGVLFSCHDLRAVAGTADRVLVVTDGRLIADVGPLTLLRDPGLLDAARLRVPRVLRWLADAVDDLGQLRHALRELDDRALRGVDAAAGVAP
ncbi:ABC transporter ATP-binding protein [Cellulomonas sp. NPDC058312]|uniref:ABC transporter ATP-binding protein n=1 Tax=Cellulomonas sp. NPDC058312 TaxID=3346441 RepID=UPI0036ECB8F4